MQAASVVIKRSNVRRAIQPASDFRACTECGAAGCLSCLHCAAAAAAAVAAATTVSLQHPDF